MMRGPSTVVFLAPMLLAILQVVLVSPSVISTSGAGSDATIYVSPSGNDDNNGTTPLSPLQTLEAALNLTVLLRTTTAKANAITIQLEQGLYPLEDTIRVEDPRICGGGTQLSPTLTIRGNSKGKKGGGVKPTLSGGQRVILRKSGGANSRRYTVTLNPKYFPQRQVWQLWRTKNLSDPSAPFDTRVSLSGTEMLHYATRNTSLPGPLSINVNGTGLNLTSYSWEKAYAYIYHSWTSSIGPLESYDPATGWVGLGGSPGGFYTADGNRFRLVNLIGDESQQQDDTFFYSPDLNWLSYKAPEGFTEDTITLLVPRLRNMVSFKNCSGLLIDGVEFAHTDSFLHDCMGEACDGQAASGALPVAAVHAEGLFKDVVIQHSSFSHHGVYTLWLHHGSEQVKVFNNVFEDLGAGAIRIGRPDSSLGGGAAGVVHHVVVDHNTIRHGGYVVEAGIGILLQQAFDCNLTQNVIHDLYYTGISTGWTWGYAPTFNKNLWVWGNDIARIGRGRLSDMGCIYNLGISPGTVFANNLCHDVQSYGYGGWGLYADEGTSDVTWVNNIVYRTKAAGMHQHYGLNNMIKNNVFAFPQQLDQSRATSNGDFAGIRSSQAPPGDGPTALSSFAAHHNIVYQRNKSSTLFFRTEPWSFRNMTFHYNCYWNTEVVKGDLTYPTYTKKGVSENQTWAEWRALGKDIRGRRADPLFPNASTYDFFNIEAASPCIKSCGFKPIDPKPIQNAGAHW